MTICKGCNHRIIRSADKGLVKSKEMFGCTKKGRCRQVEAETKKILEKYQERHIENIFDRK